MLIIVAVIVHLLTFVNICAAIKCISSSAFCETTTIMDGIEMQCEKLCAFMVYDNNIKTVQNRPI